MLVERIWTGNAYRNYNYLIACPETGEALAIYPLDHEKCLHTARVRGWQITQLLNTHEHADHTGGNAAVVAATGAKVIAHHKADGRISGVDRGVQAGDVIKVGKTVELECLDTPGHTMCHICLFAHAEQPAQEHAHNTFFRLDNASIIAGLHAAVPELPAQPDAETVFRTLRELRNKW